MNRVIYTLVLSFISLFAYSAAHSACDLNKKLGVSRTIEIDGKGGPLFGRYSYPQTLPLRKKEVVLTFDDGPHPEHTIEVLRVLKDHCTKAMFFAVGSMAEEAPDTLKAVAKDGHTIGAHSQTHPKMPFIPLANAKVEIEKSFEEIIKAVGEPVAPFFRYPGLRNSKSMDAYMKKRSIAVFSVDIVSGDTRNKNTEAILKQTMGLLKRKKRGIILLHDLQATTAAALPKLLDELKKGGYKVVHVVPKKKLKKTRYKEVLKEFFIAQRKKQSPESVADIINSTPAKVEKNAVAHHARPKAITHARPGKAGKKPEKKDNAEDQAAKEQRIAALIESVEKKAAENKTIQHDEEKKSPEEAETPVVAQKVADNSSAPVEANKIQNSGLDIIESQDTPDEDTNVQKARKKKLWDDVSGALASFFDG